MLWRKNEHPMADPSGGGLRRHHHHPTSKNARSLMAIIRRNYKRIPFIIQRDLTVPTPTNEPTEIEVHTCFLDLDTGLVFHDRDKYEAWLISITKIKNEVFRGHK